MMSISTSSIKTETGKFNGTTNFVIWQVRLIAILTKEGTKKTLCGKAKQLENLEDDE